VPNANVAVIERARSCVEAQPVLDAAGFLVGASALRQCAGEYKLLSAPVSREAAAAMYLAWLAVEGEYRVAPSTISGLNLKGWARAALQQIGFWTGNSGGSSPLETAIKNLLERPGRLTRIFKVRSGFDTLTYTARRLPDGERDRFVTEHIPCAAGLSGTAFGPSLAGGLCPLFLFGKTADALDWAERCAWAGSAQPLYWVSTDVSSERQVSFARAAEARVRERANDCLRRIGAELGWSAEEIAQWHARVERISFPAQRRRLTGAPESADLEMTVPGLVYLLQDEMRLLVGAPPTSTNQLTISAEAQRRAHERVLQILPQIEPKLAELCFTDCDGGNRPADVLAVLAEIVGDRLLVRLAVSNSHFLLSGPIERTENGARRARTDRSVGSTNKPWLLVRLLAETRLRQLCNQVPVGAAGRANDTGRQPCADGQGFVDLRRAIARSLNPPFADAVNRLGGAGSLTAYFEALGFDVAAGLTGAEFVDGLVLGYRVTASPAVLMRNMAALYRGYLGEEPASSLPSMLVHGSGVNRFSWSEVGVNVLHLREAGALLATPIGDPDGTLRSLAPVLTRHGCGRAIGKTGTTDSTVVQAVRDKLVLSAFQCGTRRYVAFGLIGSPSVNVPLGQIQASHVVRLIDALLATHNR
jgi:hypothetical protein